MANVTLELVVSSGTIKSEQWDFVEVKFDGLSFGEALVGAAAQKSSKIFEDMLEYVPVPRDKGWHIAATRGIFGRYVGAFPWCPSIERNRRLDSLLWPTLPERQRPHRVPQYPLFFCSDSISDREFGHISVSTYRTGNSIAWGGFTWHSERCRQETVITLPAIEFHFDIQHYSDILNDLRIWTG